MFNYLNLYFSSAIKYLTLDKIKYDKINHNMILNFENKKMKRKVILTGATGLIGRNLIKELLKSNYKVYILVRNISKAQKIFSSDVEFYQWDFKTIPEKIDFFENALSIIHLAGTRIFAQRWNENFKAVIYSSRINSTKLLIEIIARLNNKPESFIVASGVGYYGDRGDELLDENSNSGTDFLSKLSLDWEKVASDVKNFTVRWASIRTGIVLSTKDGALKKFLTPFKFFFGGTLGNGKQWYPWIHIDDIVGIYKFVLENNNCEGPINAVATEIVSMNKFAKTLANLLKRPAMIPIPKFILKIIFGESANYLIASQKVNSNLITNYGYNFKFPELKNALTDLIKNNK